MERQGQMRPFQSFSAGLHVVDELPQTSWYSFVSRSDHGTRLGETHRCESMGSTRVNSTRSSVELVKEPRHHYPVGGSRNRSHHDHGDDVEQVKKSGQGHGHSDIYNSNRPKLGFSQRLHHFTWAWFTLTMSTGGLSLLVFAQPHRFDGLQSIGLFIYIINWIFFVGLCLLMFARFCVHRNDLVKSLTHERESLFAPTFFLSIATLITSSYRYAIPANDTSLVWIFELAFWSYVAVTTCVAVGQYSFIFANNKYTLQTMMPTWILPIFPIMLSGTIAAVIADTQPDIKAIPILVAGLTCQGLGMSVSLLMYAHMIGRLMTAGLPNREHRTGLFMCVGPPSFTAFAFIGMGKGLPESLELHKYGIMDTMVVRNMALIGALFLWALAFWWFCVACISVAASPPKYFHLGWWAMIFPNTGFILASIIIGKELRSEGVLWTMTGFSIAIFLAYCFIFYHMVRAVIVQDIMYPGRDEDVNDH